VWTANVVIFAFPIFLNLIMLFDFKSLFVLNFWLDSSIEGWLRFISISFEIRGLYVSEDLSVEDLVIIIDFAFDFIFNLNKFFEEIYFRIFFKFILLSSIEDIFDFAKF